MYRDGVRVTVVSELLRRQASADAGQDRDRPVVTSAATATTATTAASTATATVVGESDVGNTSSSSWLLNRASGLTRRWATTTILFGIIFAYCVIGSWIFQAIEGPLDRQSVARSAALRKQVVTDIVTQLLANSSCLNVTDRAGLLSFDDRSAGSLSDECQLFLTQIRLVLKVHVRDRVRQFELDLVDMVKRGYYRTNPQWNFWSGWFYSGTIITTIGYGHIVPATTLGRAATMLYALIGAPLFLVLLSDSGKLLTGSLKLMWAVLRRLADTLRSADRSLQAVSAAVRMRANSPSYVVDEQFDLPILVALCLTLCYLLIGAAIFQQIEDWTYFESLYFVVISMFTIGFGDYVISDSVTMAASMAYFVFGLSLTSMCINIVKLRFSAIFTSVGTKITDKIRKSSRSLTPRRVEVAPVHGNKMDPKLAWQNKELFIGS